MLTKPNLRDHPNAPPPPVGRYWYDGALARSCAAVVAVSLCLAFPALAQPDPSGIEFITVRAPGNVGYSGPDINNIVTGRGAVSYEYRLGKTEVTTGQWLEFYNLFYLRVPHVNMPVRWGAFDRGVGQTPRFALGGAPDSALFPVSGPTWRTAAMFCNWLHNDKRTDIDAVMNGAYDVSTFGYTGPQGNVFTDQRAHNPDARYWIPTLDEWLKGAYYDPNYGGQNVGGWWWNGVNGSNTPLVYGPPGFGQANAAFDFGDDSHFRIPLGAYPGTVSPWGMLDAAGATSELLESVLQQGVGAPYRFLAGSHWGNWAGGEAIYNVGGEFPSIPDLNYGFRIAAAVPSSGPVMAMMLWSATLLLRRRRAPGDSDEALLEACCSGSGCRDGGCGPGG
ncbi:MAG: SUMF1/EgtB/PvdO family nonheme iron enzyme [Phycisphaerae bacterium]|nr:SUMF1/EgtB/PvdO family nonheme iron enzyme [Phycisphaerae bacterium]